MFGRMFRSYRGSHRRNPIAQLGGIRSHRRTLTKQPVSRNPFLRQAKGKPARAELTRRGMTIGSFSQRVASQPKGVWWKPSRRKGTKARSRFEGTSIGQPRYAFFPFSYGGGWKAVGRAKPKPSALPFFGDPKTGLWK